MSNALVYIGALAIAVLAALFAVPAFIDWNGYRGVFEEEASRILGREVRVGGGVNVRILPMPSVSFEKVRIADTASATGEPFFRADAFRMWLSVGPLLKGVLEATEVELKRPALRLAVDGDGVGNWTRLSLSPGSLPFVPAGVTLQSVRIENGLVVTARADGSELVRLSAVTGELAADSLSGPFRFKGTLKVKDTEGDARLATSERETDGGLRLKASWKEAGSAVSHQFDGRLAEPSGRARLEGEVTSKFAVPPPAASPANPKPEAGSGELKAKLSADARSARLADIAIALDNVGQPQLVTGAASFDWAAAPKIDLELSSRLLDLDRIGSTAASSSPLAAARAILQSLLARLSSGSAVAARFAVDQATFGAEAVSGVKLSVVRAAGPMRIEEFRAALPGGVRLDLSGLVGEGKAGPTFEGDAALRGTSLFRFLAWALARQSFGAARADGPFAFDGRIALADDAVSLSNARATFDGQPFSGALKYAAAATPRRLDLTLDADVLDVTQFRTGGLALAEVLALARGEPLPAADKTDDAAKAPAAAPLFALDLKTDEIGLDVKAREVDLGQHVLRDVAAKLVLGHGAVGFPVLRFTTAEGLGLDVEGAFDALGTGAKGRVAGTLAAANVNSVSKFLRLAGVPEADVPNDKVLDAVVPLRLAGRFELGRRAASAADLAFDGIVKGGRAAGTVRLDGGAKSWREEGADVTLEVDHPDALSLVALATGRAVAAPGRAARAGKVVVKAVGKPSSGLLSLASIRADGLDLSYHGQVTMLGNVPSAIDGELDIRAKSLVDALALVGLPASAALAERPLAGVVDIVSQGERLSLAPQQVDIGGALVTGQITVTRPEGKPVVVAADLDVDAASVPGLLTALVDKRPARDGAGSIWPDQLFDLSATDKVNGRIAVDFGRLELEPGLHVNNAHLTLDIAPGRIRFDDLGGEALSGKVAGAVALSRVPGATALEGRISISGARLESIAAANAAPRAGGDPAQLTLEFAGRAASPAALVPALRGKGELTLGAARMAGLAPAAVARGVDQVLVQKGEITAEALGKALAQTLPTGQLTLGPSQIPIEIVDGAARVAPFTIETPDGRTTVRATADLTTMQIDAEWRIEALAGFKSLLPPVSVVYVGKLRDAAALEPKVSSGSLERELTVRKMERDVEELERLRKADEERVKAEQERQRLEQERLRALQQQPAPAPQSPPATGPTGAVETPPPAPGATPPAAAAPAATAPVPAAAPPALPPPAAAQNAEAAAPPTPPSPPVLVPPRPQPAVRPPAPRRSPGDEVLRQLGN